MHRKPQILINHLSYTIPDSLVRFEGLTLSLEQRRYGIIGDNGVGKTTLLKLIAQIIKPKQGSVQTNSLVVSCPQNYEPTKANETVAETLGIADKLEALARINQGDFHDRNYEIVGGDWDIEARAQKILMDLKLLNTGFTRHFSTLSGGQKTKCLLAKMMLVHAEFILFDEPTNNLDQNSRDQFYQWVRKSKQGLLIVSHDRMLLDQTDEIIEITTKGVHRYGGNYTFYHEQKTIQQEALTRQLFDAKCKIKNAEKSVQKTKEKHDQRSKKGKTLRKKGKIDKLTANSMKGRSEKTQSRNSTAATQMIQQAEERLTAAKSRIEIKEPIHADLSATKIPNGKTVIEIKAMHFSYPAQPCLFENFNLSIIGPERIALLGNNGSGKTTLIKLILGELKPKKGHISCGITSVCYLDQQVNFLDKSLSLIDNFQKLNPKINQRDPYFALASFNFRNKETEKLARNLSGGERIRAGLAISLLSKTPPQLIILDEPTNHLDIRSIEAIENALNAYEGALIAISHDQCFLENIGIRRNIKIDA
ncbi:hypothetical protein CbuD7D7780_04395 [Coxiella burnetii]|uniref:ABC transporter ATP-binding protein n=1 Tax=Coxiella burnetii (strain Dugway 5J108-111) TaxID=434922 RepID=A9KFE5_COXBN|nr:ABC-F family ATP-binding cassette domain-containing protein [Coxiella burnetii]ABS78299.1 ABC transporter ATP-binding protein [Coxiella burnetii Dugway 5J108-111]OYK80346.1 hypothetical protein CbuD7E6568_04375 [Coxiella burnetii]OYK82466.1 hypothetical protein CbuD7D7780_04395 [Coxiella burnetii]